MDLLSLQPQVVNRSLSGKTVLLAGAPKIGKTTFCANSPKTLILAFERGADALPGAYVQPIITWSDFKLSLRQLDDDKVKEKFENVAIDTVQWAWDLCTSFICARNNVKTIGEIPYGKGYAERDAEFKNSLRQLTMMGYGLILTCHMKERVAGEEGKEQVFVGPDLDKRCLPIVNALVDVIGIAYEEWDENKQSHRYLITRSTPTIQAGSRFRYLAPKVDFTYQALADAIAAAMDEEMRHGAQIIDEKVEQTTESYDALMAAARDLWTTLVVNNEKGAENAEAIAKLIEEQFGYRLKLSEITPEQTQLLAPIVEGMRKLAQ